MLSSSVALTNSGGAIGVQFKGPTTASSTVSLDYITISSTGSGSNGYAYGVWYDSTTAASSPITVGRA